MNRKLQALILGIMCLMLTIAICVQIKTVDNNGTTLGRSEAETELKDQVLKMKEKYDNAYENLTKVEEELEKVRESVSSKNQELERLEKEIKQANTLNPSDLLIHDLDVLSIVNELKNAGAEAIDVNGKRIVSTTSIMCDGNVITINGEKVSSPFIINAIGLPEQMATLKRSGGYLEKLEYYTIKTDFKKLNSVTIPKYTGIINFKNAKNK